MVDDDDCIENDEAGRNECKAEIRRRPSKKYMSGIARGWLGPYNTGRKRGRNPHIEVTDCRWLVLHLREPLLIDCAPARIGCVARK